LVRFSRPHTVRGTVLGAGAGCARALMEEWRKTPIDWSLLPTAGLGVVALVCGNLFIVGVNQIYDVNVDRVNKPFLPLASGAMSPKAAALVVWASCALGVLITWRFFSKLIFGLYVFGLVIGALYSIPPFRLRRFPALAALTISCARGFLLNFGVYHATKSALGSSFRWSPPIIFLAIFMTVFANVIALSKDLPDIDGDRKFNVNTFAARLGPRKMIRVVVALLSVNYLFALLFSLLSPTGAVRKPVMALGHMALLGWLWLSWRKFDPNVRKDIQAFYAFIWKLFYAEYALFLLI